MNPPEDPEDNGRPAPSPGDPVEDAAPVEAAAPDDSDAPRDGGPADALVPLAFQDVVSGVFDAEQAQPDGPAAPLKRVLAPQPESPKLHKVLAQAGLGSRLEMEQLILEGRISVNNEPAHIGQRIQWGDSVKVNGRPIRVRIDPPPARVIAYHKPVGEVVTHDDPQNRPTVFRKLPRIQQGKWQSVGRLDLNTEGLLLFTSSGELANKLMHPRFGLEREYAVRVLGALSNEEKQRLLEGIRLDDGVAQFGSIEDGGGEGANTWYRVTISEGRNREVRRMFEAVGRAVSRLIRIRYGAMMLPRGLRRGAWMELDDADIRQLMRAAGAEPADAGRGPGRRRPDDRPQGRGERGGRQGRPDRSGRSGPRPNASAEPGGPQGAPGQGPRREGPPAGRRRNGPGGAPNVRQADPLQTNVSRTARPERLGKGSAGGPPDPMRTSLGYIGADSFSRQRQGQGQGRGPGGRRGPGGGGAGPSGNPGGMRPKGRGGRRG